MSDISRLMAIRAVCHIWSEDLDSDPNAPHGSIGYASFQMILRIAFETDSLNVAEQAIAAILKHFDKIGWGDLLRFRLNEAQALWEGYDEQQSDGEHYPFI